jgi:hypothetical protein
MVLTTYGVLEGWHITMTDYWLHDFVGWDASGVVHNHIRFPVIFDTFPTHPKKLFAQAWLSWR